MNRAKSDSSKILEMITKNMSKISEEKNEEEDVHLHNIHNIEANSDKDRGEKDRHDEKAHEIKKISNQISALHKRMSLR